jgi:hypothetical protein
MFILSQCKISQKFNALTNIFYYIILITIIICLHDGKIFKCIVKYKNILFWNIKYILVPLYALLYSYIYILTILFDSSLFHHRVEYITVKYDIDAFISYNE